MNQYSVLAKRLARVVRDLEVEALNLAVNAKALSQVRLQQEEVDMTLKLMEQHIASLAEIRKEFEGLVREDYDLDA